MPELLLFTPSEKVIVSKDDNSLSLVNIFTTVEVGVALPEVDTAADVLAPLEWFVLALWQRQPGETEETLHSQVVELSSPSGKMLTKAESIFRMPRETHRVYVRFVTMPIQEPGVYLLRLLYRPPDGEFVQRATFPLTVFHRTQPPTEGSRE